jgi:hypothetical protein
VVTRTAPAWPNVTNQAGTAGGNVRRLVQPVRPTSRMRAAATQGFCPAQLFVRRHRPPPLQVSRPSHPTGIWRSTLRSRHRRHHQVA